MYAGVSRIRSHAHAHDHRKPPKGEYADRVHKGEESPACFAVGTRVECNLEMLHGVAFANYALIGGHYVDVCAEYKNEEYEGVWVGATITHRYVCYTGTPIASASFYRRYWYAYKVELDSPLTNVTWRKRTCRAALVYAHDNALVRAV